MRHLLWIILTTRAVAVGLVLMATSVAIILIWFFAGQANICAGLTDLITVADHQKLALYSLLVVWSFFLFLTVLPFGTITILLAGLLLGPMAGVAQFLSLFLASAAVYEVGRERDPARLGRELSHYPKLMALAGFARRRGFLFICAMRVAPVLPSAACCLGASFFNVSRLKFYGGTLATGWMRPIAFATLASTGRMLPVCDGMGLTSLSGA